MATIYYDDDADLHVLDGRAVAVIGYGNQGRAQALNLRDSGVDVLVGSIRDESYEQASTDGFRVVSIPAAVEAAAVLFLLLPDEVQRGVYHQDVAPRLRQGHTLSFAHGYNIRYGYIEPPEEVDVILVAPRMIGVGVRERFLAGSGASAFVAVAQDASGKAWPTVLALARAIGATRAGAIVSSFEEETELDLFSEQALWPAIFRLLTLAYETLTARGYQPEAVLMEMYASGEAAQVFQEMAEVGLFRQMKFHSRTSQYGTLTRRARVPAAPLQALFDQALEEIREGTFAQEWEREREAGFPTFERLRREALAHPINEAEARLPRGKGPA